MASAHGTLCGARGAALHGSRKEGKWTDMPKAKPLPEDPVAREKVLRRRRQAVEDVAEWRKRHPGKARTYTRYAVAAYRAREVMRAELKLADMV